MTGSRKIINYFLLGLALLLGGFLLFYKLGNIPSGFYIDESLPGYNAYSILKTGKDEYGKFLPLLFRFYGSYNPPLYTYLTVFPIAAFGLSVFSVRLVSALAGLLSAIVVYKLLAESGAIKNKLTSAVVTLIYVTTPWLILYSRVGYEVSTAYLLFSLGSLLFWLGLRKYRFLLPAFFFLSLSTYAAYSERFLVPIFIVCLLFFFRKELFLKRSSRYTLYGILTFVLTQIPHLTLIATPAFFPKSNLIASSAVVSQAQKVAQFLPYPISLGLSFLREFFSQYLTYFSPRSLFFLPDPDPQRSLPVLSVFYFWLIIPFFLGIYALWVKRKEPFSKFVFLLALLSPIPAALTKDPFATHRAMPLLLPLILIIGLGVDLIIDRIKGFVWIPTFLLLFLFSLLLLWRSYFVFLPKERAKDWGYGFNLLAEEIKDRPNTKFVIDQARIKPAYIQLAFFLALPPEDFQKSVDPAVKENYYENTDFDAYYAFGKIETRNIIWEKDSYGEKVLVGDELSISPEQANEHFLTKVFEIRDPVDRIIFVGYETNPAKKCAMGNNLGLYCRNRK